MSLSLAFPDSVYSSSNKPSDVTLKADLTAIETDVNAHEADADIHISASSIWPIGSVFTSVVSTNPATLLGFGTWSQIASGKMLIGQDGTDVDFDTAEETGGAKTSTALIAHTHTKNVTWRNSSGTTKSDGGAFVATFSASNSGDVAGTTVTGSAGSGASSSIMNPYFVVYFFKRTA